MLTQIILHILFFLCGYSIGKSSSQNSNSNKKFDLEELSENILKRMDNPKPKKVYQEDTVQKSSIDIDDSKFVTKVDTESFSKDFESLGTNTTKEDNISESASKLTSLKNKKK